MASIYEQMSLNATPAQWVIPENIHTIPQAASWNSEDVGGGGGGIMQFGIPKAWGGVSALNEVNFQRKDSKSST